MVRAAEDFVRVVIRRPHAYTFLQELFESRGGIQSATPAGCRIADGTTAPLPGIYFLDATGEFLESVALMDALARVDLLGAMARHGDY